VKYVPGVLGALLVCVGLAFIFWPVAIIAAGLFLLALDRRMT
jgi:hypothetical protein